jgi:hypothetical protein
MPEDALKALGCSMALAIATLASQDAYAPANLDHFVNSAQIIVRFVHVVQPLVPMM